MFSANDFAHRLSTLRINKGISARDMSLSLGQNPSYINTIENGKAFPTMANFFAICDYLEISPDEFFQADISDTRKLNELITDLKKLNMRQLDLIIQLVKELAE